MSIGVACAIGWAATAVARTGAAGALLPPPSRICMGLGCGEGALGGVCGASASSEIAAADSELLSGARPEEVAG